VARVDRVLNSRLPVREATAEQALRAEAAIRNFGFPPQKRVALYRQLGDDLIAATCNQANMRGRAVVKYVHELSPATVAEPLRHLGPRSDARAAC